MSDGITRWSQVVRTPGSFLVRGAHPVEVPALNQPTIGTETRPGVRLIGEPVQMVNPSYTIDVTSTNAMAMLEGFIALGQHVNRELAWSSRGWGVRRRDTVRLGART
jgi:hypothetical protein